MNPVIVFGTNHSNTLGLVRSFGEKGLRAHCVLLGTSRKGLVFDSKWPASIVMFETLDQCKEHIIHWAQSGTEGKPLIVVNADFIASFIDRHLDEFSPHCLVEHAGEAGRLTRYMDKWEISQLAEKCGLRIPYTMALTKASPALQEVRYPCFSKPFSSIGDDGSGKELERRCQTEAELREVLSHLKEGSILVQEFVEKQAEVDLLGFSANGTVYIPYLYRTLRFTDHAYGGFSRVERVVDAELLEKSTRLIQSVGYEGLFSIEFLVDKQGELFFTEVNFRNDGHAYWATSGGANLPWLYYRYRTGRPVDLSALKLKREYYAMHEGLDWNQQVRTGRISKARFLKDVLRSRSFVIFNWKDTTYLWKQIRRKLF